MNVPIVLTIAVAVFASLTAPLLLVLLTARQAQKAREEDWKRQDDVAERALTAANVVAARVAEAALRAEDVAAQTAEAARLLAERQDATADEAEKVARRLLEANERVARDTGVVKGKLDVIHTLVNSNLTAAMAEQHEGLIRELAMMRELVELKKATGNQPTMETVAAIKAIQTRITELSVALADRRAQNNLAQAQIEAQPSSGVE